MSDPIAITGSLVDAKNIAVHKSIRLSIDIPAEQGAEIIRMFGWPTMAEPVPVAVARLIVTAGPEGNPYRTKVVESRAKENVERLLKEPEIAAIAQTPMAPAAKERRRWDELPPSQQAAIRCGEPAFGRFLKATDAGHTADKVRSFCDVTTRADIKLGTEAAQRWQELEREYQAWLTVSA